MENENHFAFLQSCIVTGNYLRAFLWPKATCNCCKPITWRAGRTLIVMTNEDIWFINFWPSRLCCPFLLHSWHGWRCVCQLLRGHEEPAHLCWCTNIGNIIFSGYVSQKLCQFGGVVTAIIYSSHFIIYLLVCYLLLTPGSVYIMLTNRCLYMLQAFSQ